MVRRFIFDRKPNRARLLEEYFQDAARDFKGLPLGDVRGHAQRRFTASYGVSLLVGMLEQLDRLPANAEIGAVAAVDQDKQVSGDTQAAHAMPRQIVVLAPGLAPEGARLHTFLRNSANRMWVRRNLFAPTDRVHRLVNYVDSLCEEAEPSYVEALVELCNRTLQDARRNRIVSPTAPPPSHYVFNRFEEHLVPAYCMIASLLRRELEAEMTAEERSEMDRRHPVYPDGRPLVPRPTDTRVTSPDAEARTAAAYTVREILQIYEAARPDGAELLAMANKIEGLRYNEGLRL